MSEPGAASRAGRNLPAAIAVGAAMGGLAVLTLLTVKVTFLVLVAAFIALALWELRAALGAAGISLPATPVAAGGAAMIALAYHWGATPAIAAIGVTFIALLAWRLPGGAEGYLRDVTAGVFSLIYLPLAAVFVALMLASPDGWRRALLFVIVTACSDIGGYAVGSLAGRHPMSPSISPKKTWEGLAGSAAACLAGGGIGVPLLLHGGVWPGLALGGGAVVAATLGDLAESMIKRDLGRKDMGTILPGHGGIMDRLDSLLLVAPVAWLLLTALVPVARPG